MVVKIMASTILELVVGILCCGLIVWMLLSFLRRFVRLEMDAQQRKIQVALMILHSMIYIAHIVVTIYLPGHSEVVLSVYFASRTCLYLLLVWQSENVSNESQHEATSLHIAFAIFCIVELIGLIACNILLVQ